MAINLNIKTNQKEIARKFKQFQSKIPRAIDKGLLQAGFQLVDIIRTKTAKSRVVANLQNKYIYRYYSFKYSRDGRYKSKFRSV